LAAQRRGFELSGFNRDVVNVACILRREMRVSLASQSEHRVFAASSQKQSGTDDFAAVPHPTGRYFQSTDQEAILFSLISMFLIDY
jgi:hypothetical protein